MMFKKYLEEQDKQKMLSATYNEMKAMSYEGLCAVAEKLKMDIVAQADKPKQLQAMYKEMKNMDEKMLNAMYETCGMKEDASNDKSDDGEGLDKADPKAAKKKFADRKDKDIDNDGDVDSSDEYLHKRRKAVSKALAKEAVELDENKAIIKIYQDMKAQGKKDHNILDYIGSMPKYKRISRDQMAKIIGDAKRKGIFKEEVELDEAAQPKWKVQIGKKHYTVTARNTAEANKKASVLAKKDGNAGIGGKIERLKESSELDEVQLDELTAAEKKLINQMYDKKGNLTPIGKKVMDYKLPASKLSPKDISKDKERRKEYNAYQKSNRNEEVSEAKKTDYTIYHKSFSSAVQHALSQVEKQGFSVDEDEWGRKVAMGPRKPGKGKTNSYTIDLMKGDKETRKKLQMQVYYDEGRYELNMYVS